MNSTQVKQINQAMVKLQARQYAVEHYQDHLDEIGEINLVSLEEGIMDHLELRNDEFEGADLSFVVWQHLVNKSIISLDY